MGNASATQVGGFSLRVGRQIGEGGYAYIFLAEDDKGDKYALKRVVVPFDDVDRNRDARLEQQILRSLAPHPNIVRLFASSMTTVDRHNHYFLLMEFCQRSVFDLMLEAARTHSPLHEGLVLRIWRDAAMAIHYLHSQAPPIVHRDLKVENLLLGQDNRFKLCDFGSCCVCEAPVVCHDKHHRTAVEDDISKHSTLAYRAPEQVDLYLQKPISEKVDVWALGILLFKLTVGRTPFEDPAGNVEKMGILNARIRFPEPYQYSPVLQEFIHYMLQPEPTARPSAYDTLEWAAVAASQGRLPAWPATELPSSPSHREASRVSPTHVVSPSPHSDTALRSPSPPPTGHKVSASDSMLSPASWGPTSPDQASHIRHSFNVPTPPSAFRASRMHSDEKDRSRRHSAFVEKAKLLFHALGAEGGEQGKWVIKATSSQPGFPKAKYMRKIVVAIWEKTLSPAQLLRLIMDRPWASDACVCMKMLVLVLKVLQQGPPAMLRSYLAYVGFLEEVSTTWGNVGGASPQDHTRAATYITKLCSVLIQKLNFHAAHPEFGHHFTTLAMMVGSNTLPQDLSKAQIANVLSRMLPIQQTLISVYRDASSTMSRAGVSRDVTDTIAGSLLPIIEETYVLFVACTELLIDLLTHALRTNTSNALVEVMQEQYSQQLIELRAFYSWANGIQFIRDMDILSQTQLPSTDPVLAVANGEAGVARQDYNAGSRFGFTQTKEEASAAFNRLEQLQQGRVDSYGLLPVAEQAFESSSSAARSPPSGSQAATPTVQEGERSSFVAFDPFGFESSLQGNSGSSFESLPFPQSPTPVAQPAGAGAGRTLTATTSNIDLLLLDNESLSPPPAPAAMVHSPMPASFSMARTVSEPVMSPSSQQMHGMPLGVGPSLSTPRGSFQQPQPQQQMQQQMQQHLQQPAVTPSRSANPFDSGTALNPFEQLERSHSDASANSAARTPPTTAPMQPDWSDLDELATVRKAKPSQPVLIDMLTGSASSAQQSSSRDPFETFLANSSSNPFGSVTDVLQPLAPPQQQQQQQQQAVARSPAAESTAELDAVYTPSAQPWRTHLEPALRHPFEDCVRAFRAWGTVIDFSSMQVEKVIGTGAFAVVYRAKWRGKNVAIKKLLSTAGAPINAKTIYDFKCEAEFMKNLRHPNIVEMLGTCTNPLATVMEYCERGALFSILADKSIELPWVLRRSIMLGLAQGIHYLHTRHPVIIHRDLKSLNVLLTEDWTTKVTDFGLSRYSPQSVSEQMTGQIGTYHWMAPEVINSNHYTEKADVYSYGIILWEILTRHTPYEGMQPVQVVAAVINRNQRPVIPPGTNPGLQALIEDCWQLHPNLRPHFTDIIERVVALEF